MNMVKEAPDRENEALDQEKERLDGERKDADKTSEAMSVAAKSGIDASCKEEATVLADEAKMADESEMKLFSIVAKIDPNADKVVTTTPKPVVLPQPLAKTDGTSVTSYQLVAASKIVGTCEERGMTAVAKEELNTAESVCNMVKDSFLGGIIVASVTAPKFNQLSGATLTSFNPSTCKTNEPFVTSFTYKEMEAKLEANVGKKMQFVCKTVTEATTTTTSTTTTSTTTTSTTTTTTTSTTAAAAPYAVGTQPESCPAGYEKLANTDEAACKAAAKALGKAYHAQHYMACQAVSGCLLDNNFQKHGKVAFNLDKSERCKDDQGKYVLGRYVCKKK
jgi:hypothetical protein